MTSLGLRAWGLWGLAFAVAYQLVAMMHETKPDASVLPEISPETDRNLRAILEGDYSHATEGLFAYNLVDIKGTPTGTGTKLYFLSWLVTKSWLSPILLRHMVNKNGVGFVRKLVSSKEYIQSLPVTHHPVHKATRKDMTIANDWNYKYGGKETGNTGLTRYESIIFQEYVKKREDPHHQHSNPGYRTVLDYHYVYSAQKATPTQVLDRWIEGATRHVSHLKAFANLDPVLIMEQAKASTDRWKEGRPLSLWDGVPVAIKDQSAIRGLPVCFGSSVCTGKHTSDDLPSFFLKTSGAIVVGTTVMTEGGVTPLGYNAHFDGPFNPFDVNYYSGGSSSGSVVAVASGLVPMAVGWDGGGSIRVPAAMSGMVGLAPTFGRVSFRQGSGSTNVKAGPIAATTIDAALGHLVLGQVYKSQRGLEESSKDRVFYNEIFGTEYLPSPHLDDLFLEATEPPLEGVRLGIFWDHFRDTDPEVYQKSLQVVQFLEKDLGATIVNITIPFLKELHLAHGMKILSEFGKTWEASFYEGGKLEANTEISVMLGRTFSACELLAAETLRTFGIRYVREYLFDHHQLDAIVSPALGTKIPSTPPKNSYRRVGESNVPLVYKVMKYVPMVNFLGLPALVVPIGHEETTKLPIGFQFWGDAWSEAKLLKLGGLVEERFWTATHQQRQTPPPENFFDTLEPWLET